MVLSSCGHSVRRILVWCGSIGCWISPRQEAACFHPNTQRHWSFCFRAHGSPGSVPSINLNFFVSSSSFSGSHLFIGYLRSWYSIEFWKQVLAFFSRPSKDSKYRNYWNWYHNWLGRICLFFGAVNVVVGIHLAGAGAAWKIGYGLLVGAVLIICIVLETLLRIKRLQEHDIPPAFSTNSL